MTGLWIAHNHADVGGGAFYTDDGTILRNSTLLGNTANQGGAIYADWSVQATSDAIVDNAATGPSNAGGARLPAEQRQR